MRTAVTITWLLVMVLGGGCGRPVQLADEGERELPAMKKAAELERAGDLAGARFIYESILDTHPTIARAHLALAFLLDQQGGNAIEAIYHYRRYLALHPESEKRVMIEAHIRAAQFGYIGTVFTNEAAVMPRIAALDQENAALRVRVANLEAQATQLRNALALKRGGTGSTNAVAAVRPAGRSVKVVQGDTLRIIAQRYYGDPERWREIYEANRGAVARSGTLRAGLVLIVPPR